MKRRIRLLAVSGLALLLCAVTLASAVFAATPQKTLAERFDYGSTVTGNTEMTAKELLEMLLGTSVSKEEAAYLDGMTGVSFRYSSFVPESNISTSYDRDLGELQVVVKSHRYTANNGLVVEWIPTRATIDGKTEALTAVGEQYVCTFEELLHTGDFYMTVDFAWNVTFPEDAVKELINLAYRAGDASLAEILAFEAQLADFYAKKDAFEAYSEYLAAKQERLDYEELYRQFELDNAAFIDYSNRYAEYLRKKQLYSDWQAYWAYEDFKNNRLEDYQNYVAYKNKMATVNARLQILENMFAKDSNGWQLYGSLMGDLVAQVVDRKAELIAAGGSEKAINDAGESTNVLRELMGGYNTLRNAKYESEHEKTAALYAYYTEHYEDLTYHFSRLQGALKGLGENTLVISFIQSKGKFERYRQFVSQLYVTATALDDTVKRDPEWTMYKKKVEEVVEPCNLTPDNIIARPKASDMPEKEVLPVESVAPAEKPSGEQITVEPTPPMPVVTQPTEPDFVADPDDGVIPPHAEDPGDEPQAAPMDARLRALAQDVRDGKLKERTLTGVAQSFSAESRVTRLVSIDNRKLISFYAGDGKTLLLQQTVEYGASFTAYGIDTHREPDAQYYYTFDYWALADGSRAEFVAYQDMTLVATYLTRLRSYDVTWILNGEVRTARLNYGATPTCLFDVNPTPEYGYRYEFSGWSPEVSTVTGDVTYQGTLDKIPLLFTVTWDLGDRIETTEVPYGEYPSYGAVPVRAADTYLYEFTGWNVTPTRVEGDTTYVAKYATTPLATATDKTPYTVTHSADALTVECTRDQAVVQTAARYAKECGKDLVLRWENFSVTIKHEHLTMLLQSDCRRLGINSRSQSETGADQLEFVCFGLFGEPISVGLPFVLKAEALNAGEQLCVLMDGEYRVVEDAGIELTDSATIRFSPVSSISVTANGDCNLSKIPSSALVGTLIDLKVGCAFGYEVSHAKVVTADGVEIPVQNMSFYMPSGDVQITLTVSEIIYTVIFRSEGRELLKQTYRLGEEIALPEIPVKASDAQYDYTFEKWSKDVTIAMGESRTITVDAEFTATPIRTEDPYDYGNNDMLVTVVLPIVGAVLVVGIAGTVVLLKLRKKRKRAALRKTDDVQDAPTEEESAKEKSETEESFMDESTGEESRKDDSHKDDSENENA